MTILPGWVYELRDRVPQLLEDCYSGSPGWYRLCTRGDLLPPGPRAGLGFSCYAAKIMIQCGLWSKLSEDHQTQWIRHIQSFQQPPEKSPLGMFVDPWIESKARLRYTIMCLRSRRFHDVFRANWQNRWAETRQAVATLFAMGSKPLYPITGFPLEPSDIRAFLSRLDWNDAYASGAHTGHILFFLRHGQASASQREAGLHAVLDFLGEIESAETGGWYRGAPTNQNIINGAMKITNGLYWWGVPVRHAEALARTATAEVVSSNDCMLVNRLFVLHRLADQLGQPPADIDPVLTSSLEATRAFLQPDGGLSGQPDGSQQHYYFARVSRGLPVGDLHGLTLLSWGITLTAHLSGQSDTIGWVPVAP